MEARIRSDQVEESHRSGDGRAAHTFGATFETRTPVRHEVTSPAVSLRHLTKYYGTRLGVEDVSFDVDRGEVLGFLGPNGSGKTTVLRMLMGLIGITRGSATILDHDVGTAPAEVREHIGYLPGALSLWKNQTVEEFLTFIARMRRGDFAAKADALCARLGLEHGRKIGDLSKGNKQKLGVIQAFMHDPDVLILDEPTSGLDPIVQREFELILAEARDRGAAVILSSHVMHEVEQLATHVAIIDRGHLTVVDTVESLKSHTFRTLTLTFPRTVDHATLAAADGVQRVRTVEDSADHCRIEVAVTGSEAAVLRAALDLGLSHVTSSEPALDEIFLSLTGNGNADA